jgi:formylglycine-generating enzyme required for sulfatase activity
MGKTEVTWNEYELFQFPSLEKGTNVPTERMERELWLAMPELLPANAQPGVNPYIGKESDAVSRPTTPYVEMSFGMGKENFPAISMTHYAAVKYCKWITAKTGHFYRLATEAEWEYACRAGTTTKYSFGDDESKLGDYAWHFANAGEKYQQVAKKKPNAWGLYDMHGNVAEWVLDAYVADYSKVGDVPYTPGAAEYPHVARGGSWDEDPEGLRSAARRASDASWKMRDPQLPKSKWYLTDAQFLGFRIVRPLKVPSQEEMERCWTSFPLPKP